MIYSEINEKLVFIQGFNYLKVVPLLHTNLIQLDSVQPRDRYLYSIQHVDQFSALCKNNKVYTWSVTSGNESLEPQELNIAKKVVSLSATSNQDYEVFRSIKEMENPSQLSIYDQGIFNYGLVYNKTPIAEYTDVDFYKERIEQRAF